MCKLDQNLAKIVFFRYSTHSFTLLPNEVTQLNDLNFTVGHTGFSNMAISIRTTVKIPDSDSLW